MEKIDLKKILESHTPYLNKNIPEFISNFFIKILEKVMHIKIMNGFLEKNTTSKGINFVQAIFDALNFSYDLVADDLCYIPAKGRLIVVCNHPLGGLDALAVLHAISTVRKDVKVIVSSALMNVTNLTDLFVPYNVYTVSYQRENINNISKSLRDEETLVFFPAALVSGLTWKGVIDRRWRNGPAYFAKKYKSPVLPLYIKAKNSKLFYIATAIHRRLAMILLPRELVNKKDTNITLKVGKIFPAESFNSNTRGFLMKQTSLLRERVYELK